jgi:hypothetical protein
MWWSPRNVTETSCPAELVRRTEISIERKLVTVELDGAIDLADYESCPMCGQEMPGMPTTHQLEAAADSEKSKQQLEEGNHDITK